MNKEEIVKYIKEQIDKCYVIEHMNFDKVDLSKLLDYITNLQKRLDFMIDRNDEKQDRINKAIEYIEHCPEYLWANVNTKELLNILKGEE